MAATAVGPEGDSDPPSLVEMEMLDWIGHLGSKESLDDDMHFDIGRLFGEDDASKGINNLPPWILGSVFPNLPMVLYHPEKFLSNLIKTIRVHNLHANYKAGASSSGTSSSGTNMQGSLQYILWGFVFLSQAQ